MIQEFLLLIFTINHLIKLIICVMRNDMQRVFFLLVYERHTRLPKRNKKKMQSYAKRLAYRNSSWKEVA